METKSLNADVNVTDLFLTPSSGFLNELIIIREREVGEFIIDDNDDSVTSLGSYPDSPPSDPLIYLKFQNFEPNYLYQLVHTQLHDHVLSKQISDQIVVEAQELRSHQCSDHLLQQPLFMGVSVRLTHKVYKVVSCNCAPSTTDLVDQETKEETETCAICLEDMLESGSIYGHMHNCSHLFHQGCLNEWLNRQHNSCPLCRQPVFQ
ncbi:Zinc finger RING-type [Arabidopsis thaliana x Arabidopsis arenosa]|uniref:Zinc finger RING-type n=1 Tax=Arabidopsis thaliana x Arabidopsis arenosa TaxID=1240361 RepID=A0A8T2A840_9BRAS|nr:Zinc finger RING-type [Arabidopsis thaliana x Arabidopsis arenosa]